MVDMMLFPSGYFSISKVDYAELEDGSWRIVEAGDASFYSCISRTVVE